MSTDAHHALLPQDAGIVLLPLARVAIAQEIGRALPAPEERPWLREPGACFITLIYEARLRGCIGTLEAHRALGEDVRANAVAAAFRDPRFKPLTADEFDGIEVEISLLSALEPLVCADENEVLGRGSTASFSTMATTRALFCRRSGATSPTRPISWRT